MLLMTAAARHADRRMRAALEIRMRGGVTVQAPRSLLARGFVPKRKDRARCPARGDVRLDTAMAFHASQRRAVIESHVRVIFKSCKLIAVAGRAERARQCRVGRLRTREFNRRQTTDRDENQRRETGRRS